MKTERRFITAPLVLERRADAPADALPDIKGYALVYGQLSENLGSKRYEWYERVESGAARDSLADVSQDVVAHFNHDCNQTLGRRSAGTLSVGEDDKGVWYRITPPDTQYARDLVKLIERGDVKGSSFAFDVLTERWEIADGKEIRSLVKIQLCDVSPVVYPAYPGTNGLVSVRSIQGRPGDMQPEDYEALYKEHTVGLVDPLVAVRQKKLDLMAKQGGIK